MTAPAKTRVVHLAKKVNARGSVSPLCAGDQPYAINMKRESWTMGIKAVTCERCRSALAALAPGNTTPGGGK